jgi:glycosyltransferase involved in cell wall biosynthesis
VSKSVFIPRVLDDNNNNSQTSNARAILQRMGGEDLEFTFPYYYHEPEWISGRLNMHPKRLWPKHLWKLHLRLMMQANYDLYFYVGGDRAEVQAIMLRQLLGRTTHIVSTLEGIVGAEEKNELLSEMLGHSVYNQKVSKDIVESAHFVLRNSSKIITISPFLRTIAQCLFPDKNIVCCPLGIDQNIFCNFDLAKFQEVTVLCVGTLKESKNYREFLNLAKAFPGARFIWLGGGEDMQTAGQILAEQKIANVELAGAKSPAEIAQYMNRSHIFLLPSKAEGAPKVLQEAGSCGMPLLAYGFYEPPSIEHGVNGLLAWSASEMQENLAILINNESLRKNFAQGSLRLSRNWNWNTIAPQWEQEIRNSMV